MRLAKALVIPIALIAFATTGCQIDSSSTKAQQNNTSASPESCAFDTTVDGVAAVQQIGQAPTLTIAKDAPVPTKLKTADLCPGVGVPATPADMVTVNYLMVGYKDKQPIDSSFQSGQPITFPLNQVIPGWTEGVAGMQPGSSRLLLMPADQAYGASPPPSQPGTPSVHPNEALAFIIEMVAIAPASGAGSPAPAAS